MTTIPQILTWPDQAVVDATQVVVSGVYDRKERSGAHGPYTVQNAEVSDVAGNKMRISVWNHPDISSLKGKEVILHSNQRKGKLAGVKVKHGSYKNKNSEEVKTVELEVSKDGTFQYVEVYKANNGDSSPSTAPTPSAATQTSPAPSSGSTGHQNRIHGASVGMAINQACTYLIHHGEELNPKEVFRIASGLVKVAQHMEDGHLYEDKKTEATKPAPATPENEEDVPY